MENKDRLDRIAREVYGRPFGEICGPRKAAVRARAAAEEEKERKRGEQSRV